MRPITCSRCGQGGDPPPTHRVPFTGADKERILASICGECWKVWEEMEVKVINEHRLSFLDPEHRGFLQRTCTDFLFHQKAAAGIPE